MSFEVFAIGSGALALMAIVLMVMSRSGGMTDQDRK